MDLFGLDKQFKIIFLAWVVIGQPPVKDLYSASLLTM